MRWALSLACLLVGQASLADRLISIPTARHFPDRAVRVEWLSLTSDWQHATASVAYGFLQRYDVEARYDMSPNRRGATSIDLNYQHVPAVPDQSPGIAFGVRDAFNRTADGRGPYAAATFRYGQVGMFGTETPVDLTLGVGLGAFRGGFLGVYLPFTPQLRLMAEHDSRRLTAGFELEPLRGLGFRWLFQRNSAQVSLSYVHRF